MRISDWSSDVCSSDLIAASPRCCCPANTDPHPAAHTHFFAASFFSPRGMSPPRGGGDMPHCSGASPCPSISKPFPKPLCRATCSKRPLHPSRSEEHTSELQSLMRTSYAVFCLKKKKN